MAPEREDATAAANPWRTKAHAKRPAINTRAIPFGQSASLSILHTELPDLAQSQGQGIVGQAKAHFLWQNRNIARPAARGGLSRRIEAENNRSFLRSIHPGNQKSGDGSKRAVRATLVRLRVDMIVLIEGTSRRNAFTSVRNARSSQRSTCSEMLEVFDSMPR
jgi:hypothetical protein